MISKIRLQDAIRLSQPLSVGIMIKPVGAGCNLSCSYCYYRNSSRGIMSRELLERLVSEAITANDGEEVVFNWHGGEPLLAGMDFFREAVRLQKKYADGKRIFNSIQTGGLLLNRRWADFFREEDFLVGISIDGPADVHDAFRRDSQGLGTFDRVIKSIKILADSGVRFNTLTTVNRASRGRGVEIYRFLKAIGSRYMQLLPVADAGRPENIDAEDFGTFVCDIYDDWVRHDVGRVFVTLFDSTLAAWCGLPRGLCTSCETCGGSITIDHNGDAYACDHFYGQEYCLGNLNNSGLRAMASSEKYFTFSIQKRETLPRKCLGCRYLFACGGECPGHRQKGENLLCEGYKMFFGHSEPTMRKMREFLSIGQAPADIMKIL